MANKPARDTRDYVSPMASYRLRPGRPECPDYLDPIAMKEFNRVLDEVADLQILSPADQTMLALYAEAFSAYYQVSCRIRQEGVVSENGNMNPLIKIRNTQAEQVAKFGMLFGLSPKSRGAIRIKKPEDAEPPDAFDNFTARASAVPPVDRSLDTE